ncbi:MAG: outer membrane protein assembly factor BamD [Ignavibacteria bacterium]
MKILNITICLELLSLLFLYGCSSSGSDINTDDPEKAFKIAKRNFDRGDYTDAIEDFSFIKIKFPGTQIADKVQFYLADSYFHQKEYLLAAYEYETMLKNYPLSTFIPETRYKLGLSYYHLSPKYALDQQYTKYAIAELQTYIELYPEDKNIRDAERKLNELKNKLAYKDFKSGELYMKLGNYRSANIYFGNVVENIIESDWADDAMAGQIEALINLKKVDEAKRVIEKFYKLFSKSPLKSKVDKFKNSI